MKHLKYFNLNYYGETYRVYIEATKYMDNGTLALCMFTDEGEPFCNLTTNIMDSNLFANSTTAFVDTNNCPWAEQFIVDNKLGKALGYSGASGFCRYPLYEFNLEKLLDK